LSGCGLSEYEDISREHEALIGARYKTTHDMLIYGITLDKNYKKTIDHYAIIEYPGIGGPEVLTENEIESGTLFEIEIINKCLNCLSDRIQIIVRFIENRKFDNKMVGISKEATAVEILSTFGRVE